MIKQKNGSSGKPDKHQLAVDGQARGAGLFSKRGGHNLVRHGRELLYRHQIVPGFVFGFLPPDLEGKGKGWPRPDDEACVLKSLGLVEVLDSRVHVLSHKHDTIVI
jgi:hypothetical protein